MQPSIGSVDPRRYPKPEHPFDGLQIIWKDGLPKDRAEESTIETTLVGAGLTSRYSAIKRLLDGDDDAAKEEMDRIDEEQAQATIGAQAAVGGNAPPADSVNQSAQIVAQLRGAQGGGTNTPEEGGPKPQ